MVTWMAVLHTFNMHYVKSYWTQEDPGSLAVCRIARIDSSIRLLSGKLEMKLGGQGFISEILNFQNIFKNSFYKSEKS